MKPALAISNIRRASAAALSSVGRLFTVAIVGLMLTACASAPAPSEPLIHDVVQNGSATVYPPMIWKGAATYDHDSARTLASFIQERTTGVVAVSTQEIKGYNPQYGETRPRWHIMNDSIVEHLKTHPMATDFGAWAVYVFVPGVEQSTGQEIQVLLFNKKGDVVRRISITEFENTPRTAADCTRIVMEAVKTREAVYAATPPPKPKK